MIDKRLFGHVKGAFNGTLQDKEGHFELADFFLAKTIIELEKEVIGFEDNVLQTFLQYTWPGKLREFRNVVRQAVLLTPPGEKINASSLPWGNN